VIRAATEEDEGAVEVGVALANEVEFKRWEKQAGEIADSENLFLPIAKRFEKTEFCGSGGISTLTFRYYPYLLRDEILNRNSMEGKCFEEAELWYLVFSIIHAADAFHCAGHKLGDVRPLNVFISPEGQVRVATQFSWPNEQTNYLKTVFEKEPTYLSPEELKDIGYGKLEESANFALNEAFSVGLTCLDAATLTDAANLYEPNNKFNYAKLDERLELLESNGNYSAPLALLIKALCQVEADKRPTCRELGEWLAKYENNIIELQ
jgi:serine/threonine protein kinase